MSLTDFLLQPDIAYLLVVGSLLLAMMALLTPGTGIYEIGALFAFALAGWEVINLPVNAWALILLGACLVFFVLAIRFKERRIFILITIILLILGSVFMFQGEAGGFAPGVNPVLAFFVSVGTGSALWVISTKTLEAQAGRPAHDLSVLVGALGIAKTNVLEEGTVFVNREDWTAISAMPIAAGSEIRVLERQGFVLSVEAISEQKVEPEPDASELKE
jgi:membrane-bound serine protease (ClpP class)